MDEATSYCICLTSFLIMFWLLLHIKGNQDIYGIVVFVYNEVIQGLYSSFVFVATG